MKRLITLLLMGMAFCCLPNRALTQCGAGETFNNYCYGINELNNVAFEFCPTAGMAAESIIQQGTFFANVIHTLAVYRGASGSGAAGTIVFGPSTGDLASLPLADRTIEGLAADQCLIFVINSNAVPVTCQTSGLTELQVCSKSVAPAVTVALTIAPTDEFCSDDGVQTLSGGTPSGGMYSGTGVSDLGNGSFEFDPTGLSGTITITYEQGGNMATDDITVIAANSTTFSALADLCIDAGVQMNVSGGTPSGGSFSGPGVTDNTDGTYNFSPGVAGLGVHTITYTDAGACMDEATDQVEALAPCGCPTGQNSFFYCPGNNETDVVMFEVCPSAGMAAQATITAGTLASSPFTDGDVLNVFSGASGSANAGTLIQGPLSGNLSGTMISGSVADDCLIFVLTTGGAGSCQDGNETGIAVCGEDTAPTVAFLDPGDFCITDLPASGLGGGLPTGGVYSSTTPGAVTDGSDGTTFGFTAVNGPGMYELVYTLGGGSDNVFVEVFASGLVAFTAPNDLCIDAGIQTGLGGGTPTGGTYSGSGVTDDGNGTTYTFNPALAGLGITAISYTDASGCMETAMDDIEVLAACSCPSGERTFFHCQEDDESDLVLFEICPTASGQTVQANITQGQYSTAFMDGDELTVYAGASGTGTAGRVVFGPLGGNLAGNSITGSCDNDCLTFVSSTGPIGSCAGGQELPLIVCASDTPAAGTSDPMIDKATAEFCAPVNDAALRQISAMVPSGTDEQVAWILTDAPAGSQFDGSEPLTFNAGVTNTEFDITSGMKGSVLTMRENGNGSAASPADNVYGTWTFSIKIVNTVTECESAALAGLSVTTHEKPTVTIIADPNTSNICVGTTVMYDASIISTDGGTYSYDWCSYASSDGSGACLTNDFDDNTIQMPTVSWTNAIGSRSVGVTVMSDVNGCMATDLFSFSISLNPTPPVADKTTGSLCVGQDAATVFVDDPGMNREIVWVVLEAPAGASFAMGDDLEPNVNASDYRTDLDANGRRLRIKNNAAVGTYRFKAKTRETSAGCESAPTTEEFTITVNATPAVPTIDRQDLVRCRRETATISVLPATDVEFVWEVLEAPSGVSFMAGDKLEPGVDGSDYRTDLQADGRELRTKGSARAGLYRFKVLARDVNTGCESELTADELSILINDLPMVPTPDVDMAMGCAGSTGADVSVVDPMDSDLEVSWEVLEAPAGATISMGDILAPGTADSHYRTTVPNEPYTLRIKSNNSVTPGTYRFKAFFTNASTGCVGDATTAEFVIEINENPADPIAGVATKEFCNGDVDMPSLANTGISVSNTLTADEKVVWVLTSAPAGSAYAMDDEFTTDNCGDPFKNFGELAVANSSKVIRVQDIANAPIGTYTFDAFITNCVTGCSSEPVSGFSITVNETPAVPSVNRLTRASCVGSTSTVSVLDPGTGLEINWEVVAAPAGASFMAGDVLAANVDGPDYRTDLDANGMRLRIKGAMSVAVGTYQFKAKAINPATSCESELTTEIFEINIFAQPTVDISADPDGDLCLGQLDVMYDATITSTDGGTYTFDWCAYNSGDGSGTCFGGFDDNTIQMPKRSWTTSAGPKSVGVTVVSDVQGCMATDLYSFEVVAPTMLACPANQTVTLITDDVTFDCLAEATFNNPTIIPGPCDPVALTISVDGGTPEAVVSGESFTAMFQELGVFTVTYDLEDAVGNTSTCSFDISVDGLPCGFVDNGGVGCNTSTSMFDQGTATFSLTSDCSPNTMLYVEDETAFVFTELCGDGEITAQVTGLSGTGFAGVMMRESEVANAKKMALGTNTIDRLRKEVRVIDGYPSSAAPIASFNQFWVRVTRSGDVFSAFASTDGVFWQPYLSQVIIMEECIRVGLFTYSEKPGNAVTATFTDVSVTGLAGQVNLGAPIAIGVQGLSLESPQIFPNPTSSELHLDLSSFLGAAADIRIFNAVGQIVQREQIEEVQVAVERLDVSRLEPGMYTITLKIGETWITERVIIAR